MRWNEALAKASKPEQPDVPVTIAHPSGSYQDVYPDHFFIYPAGIAVAIRTARPSVAEHILNEFDLNDTRWYVPPVFRKRGTWFAWLFCVFHRFHLQGKKEGQA